MNYFRQDNTEGFTDEQLNKMNFELNEILKNCDSNDSDYEQLVKQYSEKIFNKYC